MIINAPRYITNYLGYDIIGYHFGIEYLNNDSPIRVGIIYKNSPLQRDLDEAIFTFGYGKNINNLRSEDTFD